jgi:hypothetical protein
MIVAGRFGAYSPNNSTALRLRSLFGDGLVLGVPRGCSSYLILTPNAPMSGAEARSAEASAPLAGWAALATTNRRSA